MMRKLISVFCLQVFCLVQIYSQTDVLINEVMASNLNTIADEDGDYEDWIEIHNKGNEPVNIKGWGLSDDHNNAFKWVFPDIEIAPDQYLLVWASNKDRYNGELHTNFSIASSGEPLLLSHPEKGVIQYVPQVEIPGQLSFGLSPNQSGYFYFSEPTPGKINSTQAYRELLFDAPVFSTPGGFYSEPFFLTLSTSLNNAEIYYTLDGSMPDPQNLNGSTYTYKNSYPYGELLTGNVETFKYSESIFIDDRTNHPYKIAGINTIFSETPTLPASNIFKGTTVRAVLVKDGALTVHPATHTYFVSPYGRDVTDLPVISVAMDERDLFDFDYGIYVSGKAAQQWYDNNPGIPWNQWRPHNYRYKGIEWERSANIEYISQENKTKINQIIGVRIHGAGSRHNASKSLRLYGRSSYGNDHINLPVEKLINSKRILLRNSGQDFHKTMMRDAAIQRILKNLNIDGQAYQPAVLFINGEYWGIHNVRDRLDHHYIGLKHEIPQENLDIVSITSSVNTVHGYATGYHNLIEFLKQSDITNKENYQYVKSQIDIQNYIDYHIAQVFVRNTDWPANNQMLWRYHSESSVDDPVWEKDGRWRWLIFDTDAAFGYTGGTESYMHNTLAFATAEGGTGWPNPDWATFLFRTLLLNDEFKTDFINRFADLLNTAFLAERTISAINDVKKQIETEIDAHINRWRVPSNFQNWEREVGVMEIFAAERGHYQVEHLLSFFNIEQSIPVHINSNHPEGSKLSINSICFSHNDNVKSSEILPWSGFYFQNVPILVSAESNPGFRFKHWIINNEIYSKDPEIEILPKEELTINAVFEKLPDKKLIHYWHFNYLNNGTHSKIPADYSTIQQYGVITYKGEGTGYMDASNDGTMLNSRADMTPGSALRVRNPSAKRSLIIEAPTSNFHNIHVSLALKRTPNGSVFCNIFYNDGKDGLWKLFRENIRISSEYEILKMDFSLKKEIDNNPDFKLKIVFHGQNAYNASGNTRYDNIAVEGSRVEGSLINEMKSRIVIYPNPATETIKIEGNKLISNIKMYNTYGQLIINKPNVAANSLQINVQQLNSGLYILLIETADKIETKKIMIKSINNEH